MNTVEFLSQLNDAEKNWGLWVDQKHTENYHVGQYFFENDRLPKSFVHLGTLDELAHSRQKYILNHSSSGIKEELLAKEWAEKLISQQNLG